MRTAVSRLLTGALVLAAAARVVMRVWPERRRAAPMRRPIRSICWAIAVIAACTGGVAAWRIAVSSSEEQVARALTGGDPARAPALIRRYGCGGCHTVSAVAGADGKVAQPLEGLRQRVFIAGALRNTPDNLTRWIVDPSALSPRTAMPTTGIGPNEARDIAAFLYIH